MKMSKRNELLVELQDNLKARTAQAQHWMEVSYGIKFTPEEIKGALQHVALSYGK